MAFAEPRDFVVTYVHEHLPGDFRNPAFLAHLWDN
jgi:hypothetical protein